ncbi:MAG TPA: hypothetical protein RMH99_28570 [Sandaracinaceae bacterium LLY-WYZ-13_1]|nr:hypothetical protein [Sandaracinaceae bacterium LLY-WYZ-13_1]
MQEPITRSATPSQEPRALRILAKSVFRELKTTGYSRSDIVAFATEMLSLVSSDIREQSETDER